MKKITIAIDGPAGSGKGTTAKKVAEELGFICLDSGAIYRAITFSCMQKNIEYTEFEKIEELLKNIQISFSPENRHVYIDGKDKEKEIRTKELNKKVSFFATRSTAKVREFVTNLSQKIIEEKGVVLEGRDAASVLAPNAELKVYLDCEITERARRRSLQLGELSEKEQKEICNNLRQRDELDKKNIDIAKKNGIIVDTTDETIESQVQKILDLAYKKMQ